MKLELLVVLAVAAFIPSLTEGRLVSKCELETTLAQAANQFNLTENILVKGIQLEDVLAKIICSLDLKSGLNTSHVTNLVLHKPFSLRPFRHNRSIREMRPKPTRKPEAVKPKRLVREVQAKDDGFLPEREKDKLRPTGWPGGVNSNHTGMPEEVRPKPTQKPEAVKPKRLVREVQAKDDGFLPEREKDKHRPTGRPGGVNSNHTGMPEEVRPKPTRKPEAVKPKRLVREVQAKDDGFLLEREKDKHRPTGRPGGVNSNHTGMPEEVRPKPTQKPEAVKPKRLVREVQAKDDGFLLEREKDKHRPTGRPGGVNSNPTRMPEEVRPKPTQKPEAVKPKRLVREVQAKDDGFLLEREKDKLRPTGRPGGVNSNHTGMPEEVRPKPTQKPEAVKPKRLVREVQAKDDGFLLEREKDKHRPTGRPGGVNSNPTRMPEEVRPKPTQKPEAVKPKRLVREVQAKDDGFLLEREKDKLRPTGRPGGVNSNHTGMPEEVRPKPTRKPEAVKPKRLVREVQAKDDGFLPEREKDKLRPTGRPGGVKNEEEVFFGYEEEQRKPFMPLKPLYINLFGLFQLSDRLTCISSNNTYSLNLCNTACTSFLDDDISDDIACFVKSISWMKAMMFPWKCATLQASEYIQCNQTLSSTTSI
ncbi:titin-like isoform X1 [Esox lucius]|uniref:Glycosyl hydrolases family 22 (GH22) domain-containing protein n=1 Tax=Esox lucius TaxID=8010 RepID=A0AAY5K6B8_ESOLU|nr:titin-like isoform X1 [Esox lucius]XP_034150294.1 titin-like isoform X1 [Esox lucius]XP_034150295.1 titin-like isoform X1 [Esox lucius]